MRTSSYSNRKARRGLLNIAAGVALTGFVLGTMAMTVLAEMAVAVAHGEALHIGADILFAGFSPTQLIIAATISGAVALGFALAALVAGVLVEG